MRPENSDKSRATIDRWDLVTAAAQRPCSSRWSDNPSLAPDSKSGVPIAVVGQTGA
jgi:hypothetical protein